MKFDIREIIIAFVICFMIIGLCMVGYGMGKNAENIHWQQQAIEQGVGMYDPITGEFTWVDQQIIIHEEE